MRIFRRYLSVVLAFLLFPSLSTFAQDTQTARPRIGIALGGGGALGLAHIGVLRFLEERRIPVDLIAGTSMGGLIAGLYATGHRSSDLEKIVQSANWDDLLGVNPKFEHRPVVEKQDWNRITGPLTFRLGSNFSLPAGINTGGPLALLLSRETLSYSDVEDFDALPIPFRCVATDLMTGEAISLGEGFLPKALRATMAIPAIFTPVQWNDRILVDGGIVNNLPTDVVRDMGADVVIAVSVEVSPSSLTQLETIPGILRQSVSISVLQNERLSLALADVPIAVALGDRGSFDFSRTHEIIESGYMAAEQYAERLMPLSLSVSQWEAYLSAMTARLRSVPTSGRLSVVNSDQSEIRDNATRELSRRWSAPVSIAKLEDDLAGLIAATSLPNAFYGWRRGPDEMAGYRIELEERVNNQILIRPAFFYQYSPDEPGRFTFRLSSSAVRKDAYKSRFLTDVSIGESPSLTFESYHAFHGTPYFVAPGFSMQHARFFEYTDGGRIDRFRNRFEGSLYFGIGTWRHLQLRVGSQFGYDQYSGELSTDPVASKNTTFADTGLVWVVNTLDSGELPAKGSRINGSLGWSARRIDYPYLQTDFDHFQQLSGVFSAIVFGRSKTSFSRKLSFYDQFTEGGLTSLDAYRYQEFRANSVFALAGGIMYRGLSVVNSSFRPVFAGWHEVARLDEVRGGWNTRQSTSVGVFVPTPAGRIGAIVSFNEQGDTRFRLSLGSFWNRP